jgi:hypothetical protein
LRKLGSAAGDVDLITDVQIPIRQLDDGDAYPVEIICHDADLLFHGSSQSAANAGQCQVAIP